MQALLRDISEIRAGYSFRERIEPNSGGVYGVVQIKDLDVGGIFQAAELVRTNLSDVKSNHFLHRGDVLFVARGERKRAVVVDEVAANTVFGSQFFACRSQSGVDPTYLAWFINQKPVQRYLEEHSRGSNVRIITKEALERLVVTVPPLELQKKIARVYRLSQREMKLFAEIQAKRSQLLETALLRSLHQYEIDKSSKA
jgi:restriction endonuclease S subunit